MAYTTLITSDELAAHLNDPDWVIVDCRCALGDPAQGRQDYLKAHIPEAVFADEKADLSAPVIPGVTGRHPLPTEEEAAATFSRLGIGPGVQVVAYDAAGGGSAAARLWWMLQWLGHEAAAVLDGGWQDWLKGNRPTQAGEVVARVRRFVPRLNRQLTVTVAEVGALAQDPAYRVIDSRAAERYRGEVEPIDPVAGRIPGALNAPYLENMTPEGKFKPAGELQARFRALLGETPADRTVFYCGSGITAAMNVLAMTIAEMGTPKMFPGSWSEWITDPKRPIAKG